jgi:predicted Zn-dependent peptidase
MDHVRSVSLGIWVNAGSRDEIRQENGISHFIEHMTFKGTRNRSSHEIAKELDAVGGLSNAFTGKENTCFHARVLSKHLHHLSDLFADILLNSIFNPEDMERERQVILQEISMVEDTPDDNIHVLFNKFFWINHPIGMSILGTDETVSAIRQETITRYMKTCYRPDRIVVVAAGNVDHEELVNGFSPFSEFLESGESKLNRTKPQINSGVSIHFKELEQVHICLGGGAPSLRDEKRFAAALLNTILGGNMSSRLFQEIREKQGLAYSVYSFLSAYADAGVLGVYVASDARNVNPVLETIQREIEKIKRGQLSEAELAAAKDHLIGSIILGSESVDNRMMRNAKNEFVFERYVSYEALVGQLQKVKVDDVVESANSIFKNRHVSLATLGPFNEGDLALDTLSFG